MPEDQCPDCGGDLNIVRSGTRLSGTTGAAGGKLPEQGIPTTAVCASCGKRWQREYGDRGDWHRLPQ